MLFTTPTLTPLVSDAIAEMEVLAGLLHDASPPARWISRLRRTARGVAAASSVAIEGFHVPAEAASALLAGDRRPASPDDEVVAAYGRAMDHVVALADDPHFKWNHRVLAALHFDLAWPDPKARPGRLRTGQMGITDAEGRLAYVAPEAAEASALTAELVTWLRKGDAETPPVVRAAMAHLHLVSIHPFEDGNGRASRVLQSLVLARAGILVPELASIEEHLATNTDAYYAALQEAHGTRYDPSRSAAGWVEFCMQAHVRTARSRVDSMRAAARRWSTLEAFAEARGWPDRLVIALEQVLSSGLDRGSYTAEADVSDATASADLRRLVDAGLVTVEGGGRATRYRPTPELRELVG